VTSPRFDTVSFLTDYGTVDEFVGVVKAVIRDLAPHVTVIDLTHGIAPFDVRGGALALARCIGYVPRGVVLAVVDPGVATARRAIAVEVAGGEGVLVGPDNGLLAPAVAMAGGAERAVELTNPEYQLGARARRSPVATCSLRPPPTCATASTCTSWAIPSSPTCCCPAPCRSRATRTARWSPRCCGSTASATASSTSAPTRCRATGATRSSSASRTRST
jgi:hypothetical protein